jgi:alanyl-tRNA synthetase
LSSTSRTSFYAEGGGGEADKANKEPKVEVEPVKEAKERVYYADWIRAMAIALVIFVHCLVNSFDASGLDPEDVP